MRRQIAPNRETTGWQRHLLLNAYTNLHADDNLSNFAIKRHYGHCQGHVKELTRVIKGKIEMDQAYASKPT